MSVAQTPPAERGAQNKPLLPNTQCKPKGSIIEVWLDPPGRALSNRVRRRDHQWRFVQLCVFAGHLRLQGLGKESLYVHERQQGLNRLRKNSVICLVSKKTIVTRLFGLCFGAFFRSLWRPLYSRPGDRRYNRAGARRYSRPVLLHSAALMNDAG